jgi:hypothetical protein
MDVGNMKRLCSLLSYDRCRQSLNCEEEKDNLEKRYIDLVEANTKLKG